MAAPERDALREAAYFVERLAAEQMPLAGLVLNRVHGSGAAQLGAERALAAAEALTDRDRAAAEEPSGDRSENLDGDGIVDLADGKADSRTADGHSPAAADPRTTDDTPSAARLAAGLLRLHAERMHVLARERRTRDRFTALHPEVPVAEIAALPGDVHDLAGLRAIGDRLATQERTDDGTRHAED